MSSLEEQASDFAESLTRTVRLVSPDAPPFVVQVSQRRSEQRANIGTQKVGDRSQSIPLTVDGTHLLDLTVAYQCSMSPAHSYMRVEQSHVHLRPHQGSKEHLARLEFLREPRSPVPCSHLHVHAHRDAWAFMMARDGVGSDRREVRRRGADNEVPQLSDIHFPLGGSRMRPILEDFLELLIHELGIDHADDALAHFQQSRAAWRVQQLRAMVASMPEVAAQVLRDHDWQVTAPSGTDPDSGQPAWLTQY